MADADDRGLELEQNPAHERNAYRVRVVAAVLSAVLLAAGLAGLFGADGPFSGASASSTDQEVQLSYARFLQWHRPDELVVELGAGNERADVAISRDYLDNFEVQSISSEPERVTSFEDRIVYTFDVVPPAEIAFSLEPERIGRHRGVVRGPDGSAVSFTQWAYP